MQPPSKAYLEQLVYHKLHPKKTKEDPQSFEQFVRASIIPEIRDENVRYYGPENEREPQQDALYPGLDYSTQAARVRLGDFYGHSRLFEAFKTLNLTAYDINRLCTWEGTRSAKERYEAAHKVKVVDMTFESLPRAPRRTPTVTHHRRSSGRAARDQRKETTTTPIRTAKVDYYSDPRIWSNGNVPVELIAQNTERGLREALAAAVPQSDRQPLQPLLYYFHRPEDPNTNQGSRLFLPHVQDLFRVAPSIERGTYDAHLSTHFAPATPAYHYGPHSPALTVPQPAIMMLPLQTTSPAADRGLTLSSHPPARSTAVRSTELTTPPRTPSLRRSTTIQRTPPTGHRRAVSAAVPQYRARSDSMIPPVPSRSAPMIYQSTESFAPLSPQSPRRANRAVH